jgi:hypothetical protein
MATQTTYTVFYCRRDHRGEGGGSAYEGRQLWRAERDAAALVAESAGYHSLHVGIYRTDGSDPVLVRCVAYRDSGFYGADRTRCDCAA